MPEYSLAPPTAWEGRPCIPSTPLLSVARSVRSASGVAEWDAAHTAEESLAEATKEYGRALKLGDSPIDSAKGLLWTALDARYEGLVQAACTDGDLNGRWYPTVRTAMEEAHAQACAHYVLCRGPHRSSVHGAHRMDGDP